jgi:hypothetical protein
MSIRYSMTPGTMSPGSSVPAHYVVASRPSFPTRRRSRATSQSWNGSWTHSALPWCTCRWKESCRPNSTPSSSSYGPDEPSNTHPAATWAIVQLEAPYLDPSTNYWRRCLQNSLICIFCRSLQNYEACITLRDPVFLTNKPDTEWYPWHWGIPLTLSSSQ